MADTTREEKARVTMILNLAVENLARLAELAADQLEEVGFGTVVTVDDLIHEKRDSDRVLLVESGYEDSCLEIIKAKQIRVDHHLVLKDLGMDQFTELSGEGVELVKDGMVAECVVIASKTPKFNCPCCG